jgi:leader peptidase (prepilin peptidase)/N-methyltransferase
VLFASLSGAMVGVYLKWTQRLNDEGHIPFGPFLAGAGMIVAVMGSSATLWMRG